MTAVRFQRRGDVHAITFAYDPTIVELLKASVPSFIRSWNPDRREWLILEPVYATQFADTLRRLGHTVIGLGDPPNPTHGRVRTGRLGPVGVPTRRTRPSTTGLQTAVPAVPSRSRW